jgi:hypothetical protein
MLEEAQKLRTPQMHAALALDLNTGLRNKELREIRWEQIDLIHKKALTVGKSKTEAGTGRVIPLNETAIAALEAHAAWYTRRFGDCRPEWFVFPFETPLAVLKTPETEDIGFHSQSVPVHTEGLRFRQRLTVPPAVRGDPIAGHDRSCAVFPLFTVDKNPIPGIQNREDLNDVRLPGRYLSVHGNVDVAHIRSFDGAPFRFGGVFIFAAQVNDGLNPQAGQAVPGIAGGLAAAIEPFVGLVKVGDAGNRNIASPGQDR